jgi:hypothetical protein
MNTTTIETFNPINIYHGVPGRLKGALCQKTAWLQSFKPLTLEAKSVYDYHVWPMDMHLPGNIFFQDLYAWNFTTKNIYKLFGQYMFIIAKDVWYEEYVARPLLGPMGEGSFPFVIDHVYDEFKQAGVPCVFADVSYDMLPAYAFLEGYTADVSYDLDRSEYIYAKEDFLQSVCKTSSREAINHFRRKYNPSIRTISALDSNVLLRFTEEFFCTQHPCEGCSYGCDIAVLHRLMSGFNELGLSGVAIESNGKLMAFTIACIQKNTLFCIYQKVQRGIRGLNEMTREVLTGFYNGDYSRVNYSDDMGIEGLRLYKSRMGSHRLEHVYRVELTRN